MPRAKKVLKQPVGRPNIEIDWDEVDRLLVAGCTGPQIAGYLGVHADTLYDRTYSEKGVNFSDYKASKLAHGDALLSTKQFEDALGISKTKGNVQLLLKLGEIRLGQKNESAEASQARAFVSLFQKFEKLEAALHRRGIRLSDLEDESPLLDQGSGRKEDPVPNELGSEGVV